MEHVNNVRHAPAMRRAMITEKLSVDGITIHVSAGFYQDGRVCEIFLAGPALGTQLWLLLHDVAVIISVALQRGVPAAALANSVSRTPKRTEDGAPGSPFERGEVPATIIAAVLDWIIKVENE